MLPRQHPAQHRERALPVRLQLGDAAGHVPRPGRLDDRTVRAVRLVLEKDPFVNASQIKVSCANDWVTLDGLVKNASVRHLAEADAWYVFGVDGVTNQLQVEE